MVEQASQMGKIQGISKGSQYFFYDYSTFLFELFSGCQCALALNKSFVVD